jgi:preprotein translocase subunit SecY
MKKFFTTLKNIWSIVELRDRLLITFGYLVIFRLGSFIVLPGIDPIALKEFVGQGRGGLFGLLDTFLGGAFSKASIFGLGIMPYISASIVVQLLTVSMPYFQKMQKEGDSGRKRINQITRILTIIICMSQSIMYIKGTIPTEAIKVSPTIFTILSMIILTSGTIFCMWLGEKITDKGIGNGISMLIMIGIISRFPSQLIGEATSKGLNGALLFILEIVALFFVIMGVVALTQAVRKIPVQYAKQIVRNKVYGGQRQYIPLKVNSAGVMPIIFAQALMFIPGGLGSYFADKNEFISGIFYSFSSITSINYNILLAVLIIVFTFFYTAITINPTQIADDMKRNGGFIPGIKPGKQTSEFIDRILTKVTLPGSFFLAIVAILPAFAMMANVQQGFAYFYGGTSLLIMVGVILDTLQQIESYLLMRHYEGMMKSGKIKGRSQVAVA